MHKNMSKINEKQNKKPTETSLNYRHRRRYYYH